MANVRITDLIETSSISLNDGVLPIVGVGQDTTYKITVQNFKNSLQITSSLTASYVSSSNVFGPYGSNSILSASFAVSASWAPGGSGVSDFPYTGSAIISGSLVVTGSMRSTQGFTGSVFGTSSWSINSIAATSAVSSSYPFSVTGSSIYSTTQAVAGNRSANNSIYIGNSAGYSASGSSNSVMIGASAGDASTDAYYSVFVGASAGGSARSADGSVFVGTNAGVFATSAFRSNFIGYNAGHSASSAAYSTLIGYSAGFRSSSRAGIGSNNIIIGTSITLPDNYQNGINFGGLIFGSGSYYNLATLTTPFSGSANGRVGINQPNPEYSLDVSGSLRISNMLILTVTDPLPGAGTPTGSIMSSGSGANNKPYYWNGNTWTAMIP